MAISHGKDSYFNLDNAAGTPTDISTKLTDVRLPRTADVAEIATFTAASKSIISGLKDATITLTGIFDATIDAIMVSALGASASKTFIYGPQGSTAGLVKITGECICTAYEPSGSMGAAATFTATLRVTGDVTVTTF